MGNIESGDWAGIAIVAAILIVISVWNLRKMRTATGNLTALRKRCLLWTEVALVLFMIQLIYNDKDTRFLLVLGLIVLFAASQWLGARYYERRNGS